MTALRLLAPTDYIDIVFDTPPSPGGCQFIEVEDSQGKSMRLGEWIERPDGTWAIRFNPADYVSYLKEPTYWMLKAGADVIGGANPYESPITRTARMWRAMLDAAARRA